VAIPAPTDDSALDGVFAALADRTRRAMLARLADGPASITQLAEPFDMSLPAASKHVKVLERAGLLQRQRDGRVHRCQLEAQPLQSASQFVERYRIFWEDTLDALARYVEDREDDNDNDNQEP
jgi:DNA-binding transcriptional ArsR family regulator